MLFLNYLILGKKILILWGLLNPTDKNKAKIGCGVC